MLRNLYSVHLLVCGYIPIPRRGGPVPRLESGARWTSVGAPSSVERTVLQLLSPRSTLTATGGDFDSSTGLDRLRNQVRIVCQLTLRSFLLTIGVCVCYIESYKISLLYFSISESISVYCCYLLATVTPVYTVIITVHHQRLLNLPCSGRGVLLLYIAHCILCLSKIFVNV